MSNIDKQNSFYDFSKKENLLDKDKDNNMSNYILPTENINLLNSQNNEFKKIFNSSNISR